MAQGVYTAGGGLRITLNDTTLTGIYMPDGSLRVTDIQGKGVYDASGALRIGNINQTGVYATWRGGIRFSDAGSDSLTGVYGAGGSIRMLGTSQPYFAEDGVTNYVIEDGSQNYVSQ